jgi:hypothetical protein
MSDRKTAITTPPRSYVRSGLYAKSAPIMRLRARKVRRLVLQMRKAMPWIEDSDLPACRGWADLELLSASVGYCLAQLGPVNDNGEPRRLLTEFRHLKLAQLAHERELGMTPAARIAIKANATSAAVDLAAQLAAATGAEEENENADTAESKRP